MKLEPGQCLEEPVEVEDLASPVPAPTPRSRSPARRAPAPPAPPRPLLSDARLARAGLRRMRQPEEFHDLRGEQAAAQEMGLEWRDRGPPPEMAQEWRGQKWREGSHRWANNGGRNREWYKLFYQAKHRGEAALNKFFEEYGNIFESGPNSQAGPRELRAWRASGQDATR